MRYVVSCVICWALFFPFGASAFQDGALSVGLGYFSEDNFGKISKSNSGSASSLGVATYPLVLKYDVKTRSDMDSAYISPTITYSVLPRTEPGQAVKVTTWQFILPIGMNFGEGGLAWHLGVGVINRTYKGKGGTKVLSNGTGTSTFALPGRETTTRNFIWNLGSSYSFSSSRIGFDVIVEGPMSKKRTYDLMLSYCYSFSVGTL